MSRYNCHFHEMPSLHNYLAELPAFKRYVKNNRLEYFNVKYFRNVIIIWIRDYRRFFENRKIGGNIITDAWQS